MIFGTLIQRTLNLFEFYDMDLYDFWELLELARILGILDDLGVDYIEGGWPGANPTDDQFFKSLPKLKSSKLVAFGMMRKYGKSSENDPGLNAVLNQIQSMMGDLRLGLGC